MCCRCIFDAVERHTWRVHEAILCRCFSFWDTSIHWEPPLRNWKWARESVSRQVEMSLVCLSGSKSHMNNWEGNRETEIKSKQGYSMEGFNARLGHFLPSWGPWAINGGDWAWACHNLQCVSARHLLEGEQTLELASVTSQFGLK